MEALDWRWQQFDELRLQELHCILAARQSVFVVEQKCPYSDIDDLDVIAWHLSAWTNGSDSNQAKNLITYLRVIPSTNHSDIIIGRVLTRSQHRHQGLGTRLLKTALTHIQSQWPNQSISLSAQYHLESFYRQCQFETISGVYLEDGIPHVKMTKPHS